MTAEDLAHGQSILSSAKPDVLILGGVLATAMAEDPILDDIKPRLTMVSTPLSAADDDDYYQVMARIADATEGAS